jgi:hypothetical protein
MSIYSETAANRARILQRIGDLQAQQTRGRGDFIAGTLASLGQIPMQIQQMKAADREQAQQDRRIAIDEQRAGNQAKLTDLQLADKEAERLTTAEKSRALSDALRQAKTPFEIASVWEQFDPPKGKALHERNQKMLNQLIATGRDEQWGEIKAAAGGLVAPELASAIPDVAPPPEGRRALLQGLAGTIAEPSKVNDPTVDWLDTVDEQGNRIKKAVPRVAGATVPAPPAAGLTPDQVADNARADKQLGISQAQLELSRQRATTSARNPTDSGMTPGQEFGAIRQLRNDYTRETAAARTVQQQLALMKSSLQAVKSGSAAAGSQGVLVTFQKILDPTSVVRESEYARSGSGLSLLSQIEGSWDRIVQGGAKVPVHELEKFVTLSEAFAKNQKAFADQSWSQVDAIAKKYNLDPSMITRDVDPGTPGASAAGTVRARDPQGKLHEAPAGTALPAGWTLER